MLPAAGKRRGERGGTFLRLVLLRLALVFEAHGTLVHLVLVDAVLAAEALGVIYTQEKYCLYTSNTISELI